MNLPELEALEHKLLYTFRNPELLREALRHSSFVNEQTDIDMRDNERLEFLGDAVLNLIIGDILMARFPDLREGDLSRMRANLVNESQLAGIARSIHLGAYIQLGKGEIQTQGRRKKSILADTLEAVIAAVYLDGGFQTAYDTVAAHFSELFRSITAPAANSDFKSQLQELAQVTHHTVPTYDVVSETGPDHNKTFQVQLNLGHIQTEGTGKSKKMAEQDAARRALKLLQHADALEGDRDATE